MWLVLIGHYSFMAESDEFFENDELVKQYSEASMQEHMHHH